MKIKDHNCLIEKAKNKSDGVYSYHGYLYVVKNNCFTAFADYFGDIYIVIGSFSVRIGKCERYDRRKKLLEYLNPNKQKL